MDVSIFLCVTFQRKAGNTMTASEKLVELLQLKDNDAVAIHNPSNMFYLTQGYTGEGVVYVSAKRRVIITDFRYTEQAEKQAPGFEVVMTGKGLGHSQWVAKLCQQDGIENLRYEDDYLTVAAFNGLKNAVGDVNCMPLKQAPETLRIVKTDAEVAMIRRACQITSQAFDAILPKIVEGITEKELQLELDYTMYRLGADGLAFTTIIASGENGSLPHAIPGERKLRKGDMITMDYGAKFGGYCADMTRTVALGQPSEQMKHVYDTVLKAQEMCEEALCAGKNCFDIDKIARDYIDQQGYAGRFGHGLGHAVGIDIHEEPRLSPSCHEVLVEGTIMTVEPGVYLPGIGGVRIENSCLVKADGCEPLTTAPKQLIIL